MKKLLAVLLIAAMLTPVVALSESGFSLRSGYTWGISPEEAKALASQEGLELDEEDFVGNTGVVLTYSNAKAGDCPAIFGLYFADGEPAELASMWYRFDEETTEQADAEELLTYLKNNLIAKYGMGFLPTMNSDEVVLCWHPDDAYITLSTGVKPYTEDNAFELSITYSSLNNLIPGSELDINTEGF